MPKDDPDALAEFQQAFGKPATRHAAKAPVRPAPPAHRGAGARTPSHAHVAPPPATRPPATVDALRELLRDAEARAAGVEARLAEALAHAGASERAHAVEMAAAGARLRASADALALVERELAAANTKIVTLEGRVAQLQGATARRGVAAGAPSPTEALAETGDDTGAVSAALRRFNNACLLHGVRWVAIVGGSPAYHEVLRAGVDRRVDLRLVEGNVSRPPRFPPRTRIFVWCATELDHAVSSAYPGAVSVPFRGITRFLDDVSDRIERGG